MERCEEDLCDLFGQISAAQIPQNRHLKNKSSGGIEPKTFRLNAMIPTTAPYRYFKIAWTVTQRGNILTPGLLVFLWLFFLRTAFPFPGQILLAPETFFNAPFGTAVPQIRSKLIQTPWTKSPALPKCARDTFAVIHMLICLSVCENIRKNDFLDKYRTFALVYQGSKPWLKRFIATAR